MADLIGTAGVARLLDKSPRTIKRQAGDATSDLFPAVVAVLEDSGGAYVFDRAKVLKIRDARLARRRAELEEERARLDALEAEAAAS